MTIYDKAKEMLAHELESIARIHEAMLTESDQVNFNFLHRKNAATIRAAIAEPRSLRAWKARLGKPESWFPSLEGPRLTWTWTHAYELLEADARALLARAKEK